MVLGNLTFMCAVCAVTGLIDTDNAVAVRRFSWSYCMLPSRVGSCAVFGWVSERGWSAHMARRGRDASTPKNCNFSGGVCTSEKPGLVRRTA